MQARPAARYYLHIHSGNWQWRIEDHAVVELRHILTHEIVAEVPVVLAVHALSHFVTGAHITAAFLEPASGPLRALASGQVDPDPLPLVGAEKARREARRAARRTRKRSPSR